MLLFASLRVAVFPLPPPAEAADFPAGRPLCLGAAAAAGSSAPAFALASLPALPVSFADFPTSGASSDSSCPVVPLLTVSIRVPFACFSLVRMHPPRPAQHHLPIRAMIVRHQPHVPRQIPLFHSPVLRHLR